MTAVRGIAPVFSGATAAACELMLIRSVNGAAAMHGTIKMNAAASSNRFFRRVLILGLLSMDMTRSSKISASAIPTVMVVLGQFILTAELARWTSERT